MKTKYNAKRVEYGGYKFDSKLEADYYRKYLEGKYTLIMIHPKFELVAGINYIADFAVGDRVIDIKGMTTKDFLIKRKLFEWKYNKTLEVITATPAYLREWFGDFVNMDTLEAIEKIVKKHKKKHNISRISKDLLTPELIEQIKKVS